MARLLSLFSALKRRLHQILFEESDSPFAPVHRKRHLLHNALLIQGWAAMIGIFAILLAPIMVSILAIPYFVFGYVCFAFMGMIVMSACYVKDRIERRARGD